MWTLSFWLNTGMGRGSSVYRSIKLPGELNETGKRQALEAAPIEVKKYRSGWSGNDAIFSLELSYVVVSEQEPTDFLKALEEQAGR